MNAHNTQTRADRALFTLGQVAENYENDCQGEALTDFLADLMHAEGRSFVEKAFESATMHHEHEAGPDEKPYRPAIDPYLPECPTCHEKMYGTANFEIRQVHKISPGVSHLPTCPEEDKGWKFSEVESCEGTRSGLTGVVGFECLFCCSSEKLFKLTPMQAHFLRWALTDPIEIGNPTVRKYLESIEWADAFRASWSDVHTPE